MESDGWNRASCEVTTFLFSLVLKMFVCVCVCVCDRLMYETYWFLLLNFAGLKICEIGLEDNCAVFKTKEKENE